MTSAVASANATAGDIFALIRARVPRKLSASALDPTHKPETGDHSLNAWSISPDFLIQARTAAVLVGLVDRGDAVTILLTQRTGDLRDHAGQIAFPGGKMDPHEVSPAETAVREAQEEIGLVPDTVETLGYLDPYLTRTGFRIVPVIARITPPFALDLNPAEVVDAFEVPFDHVMEDTNYRLQQREWMGHQRSFYAITYGERVIWGATAGILHILHERLRLP